MQRLILQGLEHVILDFTIITMEFLHLTAYLAMETVQLALVQPIQIEQAVSILSQKQQTPVLVLVYRTTSTQVYSLLIDSRVM